MDQKSAHFKKKHFSGNFIARVALYFVAVFVIGAVGVAATEESLEGLRRGEEQHANISDSEFAAKHELRAIQKRAVGNNASPNPPDVEKRLQALEKRILDLTESWGLKTLAGGCGKFSISAVVQCTSVVQLSGQSHFKLEALSADKYQMCRTFGQHIHGKPPYRVSAELLNQAGWAGINSGHPGLLYNAIDENNFDFVYFRPHSASGCYQTGYMSKGNLHFLQTKACPNGPPKGGVWFPVSIMVNDQDAQIFYNEDLVASVKAHFAARAWGGVFTFHGHQNVVLFRKFQLVPQLYVSQGCAKVADWSDYVMLDANHGAWPKDGFCHVMYVKEGGAKAYQLSVEMFNFIGYQGVNSGHLGVMFNAQDENNFDFVYFRPHSVGGCFQTGYVYKGQPKFDGSKSSVCPHGPPKGAAWFQVQIAITAAGQATVYLKGSLVTSWMSRYPIKSRGGVVVANGYQNVVYFRNFQVQ